MSANLLYEDYYLHLLDLIQNGGLLFGFGRTSAWQIDSVPNPVPAYTTTQPQCFGYVKANATPVIQVDTSADNTITILDNYYIVIDSTLESLRDNECNLLLFEGSLVHNDITGTVPAKYRSVGLYRNAIYIPGNTDTSTFIPVDKVAADLFYLRNSAPVTITPNVTEDLKEVVAFR